MWRTLRRPDLYLLLPEGGAQWIRYDAEPVLFLGRTDEHSTWFRTRFNVEKQPSPALALNLRAFRRAQVSVNGVVAAETSPDLDRWKTPYVAAVGHAVRQGENELVIRVDNWYAPPCLLAYSDELGLSTDASWEASADGVTWSPARAAAALKRPQVAEQFPRADRMFLSYLPLFVFVFIAALVVHFMTRSPAYADAVTPGRVRALLYAVLAVMFLNNMYHMPGDVGFDIRGHFEYINYIVFNWRLPLAREGWTMFQAPLFHLLSAPIFAIAARFLTFEPFMDLLRIIPMISAAAQIEIAYRIVRAVYPRRNDLHIAGMAFAALTPMNLYMGHYPGNESLCACLNGISLVLAFEAVSNPDVGLTRRRIAIAGLILGLALLAKVSALVMAGPLSLMYAYAIVKSKTPASQRVRRVGRLYALLFGTAVAVSGWWYVRNFVTQGHFFFGGWEPERGILWWQDPGYRTPSQFLRFGEALTYPVYSMLWSFWDGFYATFWMDASLGGAISAETAPPWNYTVALAGMWWALVPTLLMVAGAFQIVRATKENLGNGAVFAPIVVAVYIAATLYYFLDVPYYCLVKASFTLSALPCYALLFVSGLSPLLARGWTRPVFVGLVACWAFASFGAAFIL